MQSTTYNRRDMLKLGGALVLGSALSAKAAQNNTSAPKPDRPITAVVLGAGSRGNRYASYSEKYPDELKIVGVAEPIDLRRERFSKRYNIPEKYQWVTWEHALEIPKFADALIITTPDALHYGPAMGGLALDYDMILEKVVAQTWQECNDILKLAKKQDRIVAVCHVLRYSPYFRKLKEIMDSGILGNVTSIQHKEKVEHVHMSHSFVRGNWRNKAESNPMILSKSCHDLDILRWLIGKSCLHLSSFGSLKHFRAENAPKGSTPRCTDGCAVEAECPYSALRIYYRNRTWLHHMDLPQSGDQGPAILEHLKNGQYGRCVYHCDNDVVDHQIVAMQFENQITATFNMEAFTSKPGRETHVMGTMGDVVGDEHVLTTTDFRTGQETVWDVRDHVDSLSGHGGGDYGLVHDFVRAVDRHDESLLTSNIEASMESHLMGFMAEKSRLNNGTSIKIELDI